MSMDALNFEAFEREIVRDCIPGRIIPSRYRQFEKEPMRYE